MHESNGKEILFWLIGKRRRYRVKGDSMLPLLRADDEVLVNPNAYRRQSPQMGDIVIACHPAHPGLQIIKRIKGIDENGQYLLRGDHPDPTRNSSVLVSSQLVLGRVTSRFSTSYN